MKKKEKLHIEDLVNRLSSGKLAQVKHLLDNMHPSEVADLIESLPTSNRHMLWRLVEPKEEGKILLEVDDATRDDLIAVTSFEDLQIATKSLDYDQLADLLGDLPDTLADRALAGMEKQRRKRLEQIMVWDEDTAGRLMNVDVTTLSPSLTVDFVLRYLRHHKALPKHTDSFIVVDHANRYLGLLDLSELLTAEQSTVVRNLMRTDAITFAPETPATEVARAFGDRDLLSAPVLNQQQVLLGRITIDDVLDVIRDEAHQAEFGGAGLSMDEGLFSPAIVASRSRSVWLGVNLLTAFLAAWILSLFQETLEKAIVLAILIPVVGSMGGIAGSQTLTLVTRGIAMGHVSKGNISLLFLKEFHVGILNSLLWAVAIGLVTALWFNDPNLGVIIAGSIVVSLICAALSGVAIPVLLHRVSIDPAIAGSVLLTTITDVIGIISFLGLATFFLF